MDKDKAYLNNSLWLPKSHGYPSGPLIASLSFRDREGRSLLAYEISKTHVRIPREYLTLGELETLPCEVVDETPREFPRVSYRCHATPRSSVQTTAKQTLLEKGSGVLSLGCGMGKTVVTIMAAADVGYPALVIVNSKDLRDQWVDRFLEFTDLKPEEIGTYQGQTENWKHPVCIALIHTLADRVSQGALPEGFEDHFGVVIYDEVHHLGAPTFSLTANIGKGIRWGLSATPSRDDGLDALYQAHIGPVLYQFLEHDIVPHTVFITLETPISQWQIDQFMNVRDEVNLARVKTWLGGNDTRNGDVGLVVEALFAAGRHSLVLTDRTEQIDLLHACYPEISSRLHGKMAKEERSGALHKSDLVFATTTLAKEGLDRKDLDTVVLVMPLVQEGMFRQILGRIQRECEGKSWPLLVVLEDTSIPTCVRMCAKLRSHLIAMKYPYDRMPLEKFFQQTGL